MNVLIDDNIRAVLCDFGLSRMKADATSRTARHGGGNVTGSRNWMAPERIVGGSPKTPSDIYAFGMTIFEVSKYSIQSQRLNLNRLLHRSTPMKFRLGISIMSTS